MSVTATPGQAGAYFKFSDTAKPEEGALQIFVPATKPFVAGEFVRDLSQLLGDALSRANEDSSTFDKFEVDWVPQIFDAAPMSAGGN